MMEKINASKFSGEKEGEDDATVLSRRHLPLFTNNLQVISCGRRASSSRTDDVGAAPSKSSVIPPPAVHYNPTPPTPYFNFLDDQNNNLKVDEVDLTLRLSNYGPRNSDVIKKRDVVWPRPDFLDGVEDDDVDTTLSLRLPGTADPDKYSRMQEKGKRRALDHNRSGDDQNNLKVDEVDLTLRLSNYALRKSDVIKKRNVVWPRPDFLDGVEDDDVDTTLSLRLPGTADPEKYSRMQEKGKRRVLDHNPSGDDQNNNINLKISDEVDTTLRLSNYVPRNSDAMKNPAPFPRWLRPDFMDGVEDDDVDTTLSLRLPGSTDHNPTGDEVDTTLGLTKPAPFIRWPRPDFLDGVEDDDVDTTLSLRLPGTPDPEKYSRMKAKGKRRADADETQRKKTSKRRKIGGEDDDDSRPLVPMEQIPRLMKAVESRNGSRPIFLYCKILEESDVKSGLNRLFVTRRKRVMDFLRAEEAAAVDNIKAGAGLKVVGVDGRGNAYDKVVLKKWRSVDMMVINSDWQRVVAANSAQKGDAVEIWGFRADEKPCLAFNFRRENAAGIHATTSKV